MITKRLNTQNSSIDTIELNENKFQVWNHGSIMQVNKGSYFFISNAQNFHWATNFISFDEAKRHADILINQKNMTGGIKIFSGNKLYAHFTNGEWIIYDEPKGQLL